MSLGAEELNRLRYGQWSIDCPSMSLRSRDARHHRVYSGLGTLKQVKPGVLGFKLYSTRKTRPEALLSAYDIPAGQLIPEDRFLDLHATDIRGREWTSERILVHNDVTLGVQGKAVIEASLQCLKCRVRRTKQVSKRYSSFQLTAFQRADFPKNSDSTKSESVARGKRRRRSYTVNAWRFRCLSVDFLAVQEDKDLLTFSVRINNAHFPKYFRERVCEAFQFLLGEPISWELIEARDNLHEETILTSRLPQRPEPRFRSPLGRSYVEEPGSNRVTTKYHRRLFEQYLRHALDYAKPRHPLWGQLNELYESSTGSFIDAYALAMAVAIEALLEREFPGLGSLLPARKRELKDAQKHLASWSGNEHLKQRIYGAMSQLEKSRAGDKLRALVEKGRITKDQRKIWETLRNAVAHGAAPTNLSDLLFQAKVLFYHLVFVAIGYKGPYMDYGTLGWPMKIYGPRKDTQKTPLGATP